MKKLNDAQIEAVTHGEGPLLIIAGAGTGKTTVITERVVHLVNSGLAKPDEILALTFTEKAAREMEERVDVVMPYGLTQMWISTFHSFCDRILRREGLHIGLDTKYRLMTQAEAIQLLRSSLFDLELEYFRPLGNPTRFLDGMISHFSRLQDEDITPAEFLDYAQKYSELAETEEEKSEAVNSLELARAFNAYDKIKVKNGLLDFGDLIAKTLLLFRSRPNILKTYKTQFKYILVDEFQDTNFSQNQLAMLLAGQKGNITVVGDDDQAVYRFRGAAVSNILQFRKNYPEAKVIVLTQNYRSTQEILDHSYNLIQHNNPDRLEVVENIDKKLISQIKSDGDPIEFIHADRVENEADLVVKKIEEITKKEFDYKDIAILVRANNHADPFIRSLTRHGIPYQFLGPGRLFRQSEVVDLISYLKVLTNLEDSLSFYRVLSQDALNIPARDLATLGSYAKKNHISLFEAAEQIEDTSISSHSKETIQKIVEIINAHLKKMQSKTAGQILYNFLEEMNLLPVLLNPSTPEAEKRAANLSKLFDKLKSYEVDHEDASVTSVVDWIDLSMELGESPMAADTDWMDVDAVNILTVHSAKGLEFPVVFLVNLVSQRFPTTERSEQIPIPEVLIKEVLPQGDYHLQEERRLFYVGMTRARERLVLTAANFYGEGKREKKLSPFIFEALGEDATSAEKSEQAEQLSFLDFASPTTQQERKQQSLHIDYLSYSQLEAFRVCPLHYKLRYILGIPTPVSFQQSLGTSVHAALKDFYLLQKTGTKVNKDTLYAALAANWQKEGYKGKKHMNESYKRAQNYLSDYFDNQFDPQTIPLLIEQPFVVSLTKEGERPLKIGGVIDRVDDLASGTIEILDYKTGARVPDQKEVDKNLQLTFYALASTKISDFPFGKDPKDVKLSLYYFEGNQKITTKRTASELQAAIYEIFEVRREIEESDFVCSKGFLCQDCEYALFCKSE